MLIRMDNVSKVYRTGTVAVPALQDVNILVEKGEFISIMGPSGSGKSTLMNLIGCLDRVTEGRYELDGIEISQMNEVELAVTRNLKIGFVFQSFNLLPRMNALQNVELPMVYAGTPVRQRRRIAEEMLEKVELHDRMHHKPNELSGGQKQRVAIARALVNTPAILLADEPTGNLDSASGDEIMKLFSSLNKEGMTVLVVTHELDIARHARRIVGFRDGRIVRDESMH